MVKIISDSTCDLSQALIEKYDITILPLHILLGDKEYRDGADITPEEIFAWSDENKTTPKTSAPSLVEAVECLRSYVEAKTEVICFSIKAAKPDRVFITHSGCDKATVDKVREYLKGLNHFNEIIETRAGGVISSHCGPGTLGVLFIAQ